MEDGPEMLVASELVVPLAVLAGACVVNHPKTRKVVSTGAAVARSAWGALLFREAFADCESDDDDEGLFDVSRASAFASLKDVDKPSLGILRPCAQGIVSAHACCAARPALATSSARIIPTASTLEQRVAAASRSHLTLKQMPTAPVLPSPTVGSRQPHQSTPTMSGHRQMLHRQPSTPFQQAPHASPLQSPAPAFFTPCSSPMSNTVIPRRS